MDLELQYALLGSGEDDQCLWCKWNLEVFSAFLLSRIVAYGEQGDMPCGEFVFLSRGERIGFL